MTPIPTEYRGIRFRSKCEAVFARNLDLNSVLWEYEPTLYTDWGYVPDFRICKQAKGRVGMTDGIIEYKPTDVTQTYLDNLSYKISTFPTLAQNIFGFVVACGNAYEKQPRHAYVLDGHWKKVPTTWMFQRIEEASTFRFDLSPTNICRWCARAFQTQNISLRICPDCAGMNITEQMVKSPSAYTDTSPVPSSTIQSEDTSR